MRIALLHLAIKVGDVRHNEQLLQSGVVQAAELGAEWVVTPELTISGYEFVPYLGTGWIAEQPDAWVRPLGELARQRNITVFFGHAERDPATGRLHNAVLVIGPAGNIIGRHRKRAVIPGAEDWSSRNEEILPIAVSQPRVNAGVLVCADAYSPHVAQRLAEQGAGILISSAAWGPHPHGPEGCWEDRSRETGLPLFVCNRTGVDHSLDLSEAESVVAVDGRRVVSFKSLESTVILVEWDLANRRLVHYDVHPVAISRAAGDVRDVEVSS